MKKSIVLVLLCGTLGWVVGGCPPDPTITGTVTFDGAPLSGMLAWILAGEVDTPDSMIVEPVAADGTYEITVSAGDWEVFAVVDVDGSGSPGGAWYDAQGHAPDMPFSVGEDDVEGADINVEAAYPWIASCFDGNAAWLVGIGARVLTSDGDDLAGEATVTVSGGNEPIELDPDALAREWVPWCSGGVEMDGATDYTFTVSHPVHYDPEESFTATSTPRSDRALVDAPEEGDVVTAGSPLTVEWTSPDGPETYAWVQVWWHGEDADDEPIWDEMAPGPSLEIPGDVLGTPGPYSVILLQARDTNFPEGGSSQAWGLDEVFFSAGS